MALPDLTEIARGAKRRKRHLESLLSSFEIISDIDAAFLSKTDIDSVVPKRAKECWLVGRYGLETVLEARQLIQSIEGKCVTACQYKHLLSSADPIVAEVANILQENFTSISSRLCSKDQRHQIILTPPSKSCLACGRLLVSNHETKVLYWILGQMGWLVKVHPQKYVDFHLLIVDILLLIILFGPIQWRFTLV